MRIVVAFLLAACALVDCVGDSSPEGGDASPDGTVSDGALGEAAVDAASDVTDASVGDSSDGGQTGCGTAPFTDLAANCDATACVRATGLTCDPNTQECKSINNGKPAACGTAADCDAASCCLQASDNIKAGCPTGAVVNLAQYATACTNQTNGTCPTGAVQVCVTSAECKTGTCQDTVFEFNNTQSVHFGTCR